MTAAFGSVLAHTGADHAVFVIVGVGAIGVYAVAWLGSPTRTRWQLGAWLTAVVAVLVASSPPFERLAERTFTGHMVQHLAVILVAAPASVIAHPVNIALRSGLLPASRFGRKLGRNWQRVAPAVGPASLIVVLYATHLTALYDDALGSRWIHELEHAAYLGGAVATWSALLASRRSSAPARIAGVFAIIASSALLAMIMMTTGTPLVATYAARLGTAGAIDDQRSAAALMWVSGMATTLPLMVANVWRWAATEERIALRQEAAADARPTTTDSRLMSPCVTSELAHRDINRNRWVSRRRGSRVSGR